ncbi:MAG: hydroxylamine reductase [Bacteroidales bacterium]|nr:hydroxylamine reductase [Bacteroidales bacterium]HOI31231.1 hydroxylamine reductase [Bacteroidales bacterium]
MEMFCYQCQEAAKGIGCEKVGVCGKNPEVAIMQDMLVFVAKGVSVYAQKLSALGTKSKEAEIFVWDALFTTITNANFDYEAIKTKVLKGLELRNHLHKKLKELGFDVSVIRQESATWFPVNEAEIDQKALTVGVMATKNEDVRSLRELVIYGLKGMAAYGMHALHLGYMDDDIINFTFKALVDVQDDSLFADELTKLVLETGSYGVKVMALLDKAHNETYGSPEITKVKLGVGNRPGILISGHDLKDLEQLLAQSKDSGIDIYTHSEMLPAHYYPKLKQFKHLYGNYGNAWWKQKEEFETFNGPILFTTNCIVPPRKSAAYADRVYTTGSSGFTGFPHIEADPETGKKDFMAIIEHAKKCKAPVAIEDGEIVGGFAHNQVIQLADKIIDAVKSGTIKKFFVMGGCDGRMISRNYYTEFAEALPKDTVILTAGCAKYRYNKLPLGDIGGIPRVLDAGQCNDSYSLAIIALKLKEIFKLDDINELPIAYNIAWYEQKAVIVLLALLSLGVKNIHLGPGLPAFFSPNVADVLVQNFGISPIDTVEKDLLYFMA